MVIPSSIEQLVKMLGKMPGTGPRSARRIALHLLKKKETLMLPLAELLQQVAGSVRSCDTCGNWDTVSPCSLCSNPQRAVNVLCVVESVADLWALERSGLYKGQYHVLGGTLSALTDTTPEDLRLPALARRCTSGQIEEVVLALSATLDGQTTCHYIAAVLSHTGVTITRLAQGVPMGGELEALDEGTLSNAMQGRVRVGAV